MARAYYGSRVGGNTTLTPEGFRVCHNVPIARTGWQNYLDTEIGVGTTGKLVKVYRSPEQVFHPAAIASFEGKSVTDDHPTVDVSPDNYSAYEKGHVTNVRRGTGDLADCLVADLVVKDAVTQSKVENGKRDISSGYECEYEPIEGGYSQIDIRGNHVAIVQKGRAGPRVSIKDQKPETGGKQNVKIDRNSLIGKMLKGMLTMDASPEELAEANKIMGGEENKGKDADPNEHAAGIQEVLAALKSIEGRLEKLEKSEAAEGDEPDALDALEKEISTPAPAAAEESEEESVTVPAKAMEEEPGKKSVVADSAALLSAIRAAKPIVAGIQDKAERKRVSDAMATVFRQQMAAPAPAPQKGADYADMLKRKTKDSAAEQTDPTAFGKACAKANPHAKK